LLQVCIPWLVLLKVELELVPTCYIP